MALAYDHRCSARSFRETTTACERVVPVRGAEPEWVGQDRERRTSVRPVAVDAALDGRRNCQRWTQDRLEGEPQRAGCATAEG